MVWKCGPTTTRFRLASELRRLREQRGIGLEEAARTLKRPPSHINRVEIGLGMPNCGDVKALLELYGAEEQKRDGLLECAAFCRSRQWWEGYSDVVDRAIATYLELEWDAVRLESLEANAIHALLQTPEYARELFLTQRPSCSNQELERLMEISRMRQAALAPDHGLTLDCLLTQPAIERPIGTALVVRKQLEHLLALTEEGSVMVQVLPSDAPSAPFARESFTQIAFKDEFCPELTFRDRGADKSVTIAGQPIVSRYSVQMHRLKEQALSIEDSREAIRRVLDSHVS